MLSKNPQRTRKKHEKNLLQSLGTLLFKGKAIKPRQRGYKSGSPLLAFAFEDSLGSNLKRLCGKPGGFLVFRGFLLISCKSSLFFLVWVFLEVSPTRRYPLHANSFVPKRSSLKPCLIARDSELFSEDSLFINQFSSAALEFWFKLFWGKSASRAGVPGGFCGG